MSNKKIKESLSPIEQIGEYLKENKQFHLNYEPTYDYTVSSGSLMLDLEMGGGLKPSIFRATGISEGGKTSCSLSFAKNFLNHSSLFQLLCIYLAFLPYLSFSKRKICF